MSKTIAILEPEKKLSTAELNSIYHEKIDEAAADPNVHFIVSETFMFAIKYLSSLGFRKCTVYALNSRTNPVYKTYKVRNDFTSMIELREALIQNSTDVISGRILEK